MKLKNYQEKVLEDFRIYLNLLSRNKDLSQIWNEYKAIKASDEIYGDYNDDKTPNIARICYKVPTGGGKTILAMSSISIYYDEYLGKDNGIVVYLVPNEAIYTQVLNALKDPNHHYRKALESGGKKIKVYKKLDLLGGVDFNKSEVENNLCICVLMAQSLRSNKKEDRKVYEINGALGSFDDELGGADLTLMNVLAHYQPLIIADESHRNDSELSAEMLNILNPSFILELSATPKNDSNLLSFVSPWELRQEQMIKLPLIVYKMNSEEELLSKAISIRESLEKSANQAGEDIRPIVLLQAKPSNKDEEEKNYAKIKEDLIKLGIPKEQIAIKTANINEIKDINLMSKDCEIRYIITINALKEGWDCPNAYVLASLANKSSQTDIEQIVGRILRQPRATKSSVRQLNKSYVITYSDKFDEAITQISKGLQGAGFSANDYRINTQNLNDDEKAKYSDNTLFDAQGEVSSGSSYARSGGYHTGSKNHSSGEFGYESYEKEEEFVEFDDMQTAELEMLSQESEKGLEMQINEVKIKNEFKDLLDIKFPYFAKKIDKKDDELDFDDEPSIYEKLAKDNLYDNSFNLDKCDGDIKFDTISSEVKEIDINQEGEYYYNRLSEARIEQLNKELSSRNDEDKRKRATEVIKEKLKSLDFPNQKQITSYISRVLGDMVISDANLIDDYAIKIKEKIIKLLEKHAKSNFEKWCETDKIVLIDDEKSFSLPNSIKKENDEVPNAKSLFGVGYNINNFEKEVIDRVSGLDNVRSFYRNRSKEDFCFNAYINFYPDFIIFTDKNIVFLETKGDHLDNEETNNKNNIATEWIKKASLLVNKNFKFYLVFQTKEKGSGYYNADEFIEILKDL